jgi:alkanesulfonate monooxygenase SsuD/methylene tetrahydromethanopterin reductase-like flavin-dependent oxidoreductase (luciferase family)
MTQTIQLHPTAPNPRGGGPELGLDTGLDFFCVGEHHRKDFSVAAPEVVLAAIAAKSSRIYLGSAVTVLSTDDPVRVFQRFSTLNAISSGRAEVIVGRGSFTESFPLFGYDMSNYEALFEEKLNLFAEILKGQPVTWSGRLRAPLSNQIVYPPIEKGTLRTWVAVGGSPESVVRAAHYGLPLILAIIGGSAQRFAGYAQLYRQMLERFGKPELPIGVHSGLRSPVSRLPSPVPRLPSPVSRTGDRRPETGDR